MNKNWRLIVEEKSNGYYNMAADEALLLHYQHTRLPTLRIYGWAAPFLTLGYNQKEDDVLYKNRAIPFINRITGGASILHDQEITYSLVCGSDDLLLPRKVKESYKILCAFLLEFYRRLGLHAAFAEDTLSRKISCYKNFCFSSYEPYDIIIKNKKIGGNAQRRRRDIIFQHGSIPQRLDTFFIETIIKDTYDLAGKTTDLHNLLGEETDYRKLQKLLADSFKDVFDIDFSKQSFSQEEHLIIKDLIQNKYKREN